MRKFAFLLLSFVGLCTAAQVNVINVESNRNTATQHVENINGIPVTQDIGGVDFSYDRVAQQYSSAQHQLYNLPPVQVNNCVRFIRATNYNPFPVTVLARVSYNIYGQGNVTRTFTIVIPPAKDDNYPYKDINLENLANNINDLTTITRKVGGY